MNVSDTVHAELRRRLLAGYYDPGSQLKEEHLADEMNVSRTPVRAAIQRLISEGLLEPAAKRGAVVKQWRDEDIEDIFGLRVLLEGQAAALAAKNMDEAGIERMRSLNETIVRAVRDEKPGYLDEVNRANLAFHMAPYEACGSAHLRMFGSSLLEYPLLVGGFYIYSDDDMQESIRQHTEIVSAIAARDPNWARAAVACHLSAAIRRFRRSRASETDRKNAAQRSTPADRGPGEAALGADPSRKARVPQVQE